MSAPGKEKDKESTLNTKLSELLGADAEAGEEAEKYVDLTITCSLKGGANDDILDGIPPLRVHLV